MKSLTEFTEEVVHEIPGYLSSEVKEPTVWSESVLKQNDQIFTALCIQEESITSYPRIYLEEYYAQYLHGESMDEILKRLSARYDAVVEMGKEILKKAEIMKIPEEAKKFVAVRLVNKDRNQKLLEDRPHMDIGDLTCIYDVELGYDSRVPVTEKVLTEWGMSPEDLHSLAMENSPRVKPAHISTVKETLPAGLLPEKDMPMMVVISNKDMLDGASTVLYPGVLEEVRDRLDGDFYILPSSVHEMLAVRKDVAELPMLENMVRSVNETMVGNNPQDILSDHVYKASEKGLELARSRPERQRTAPDRSMDAR